MTGNLTTQEREYYAMKAALQAIASDSSRLTIEDAQRIARQVLLRFGRCVVCGNPIRPTIFNDSRNWKLCSDECQRIYRTWSTAPVFRDLGGEEGMGDGQSEEARSAG